MKIFVKISTTLRLRSNIHDEKYLCPGVWFIQTGITTYHRVRTLYFPGGSDSKSICLQCGRPGFDPWVRKIPWRRKWQPTPVLLPGESHGWRSLVGYSPGGCEESGMAERLHFLFFLSFYASQNWNLKFDCRNSSLVVDL